ncbi:head decoration protein [Cereibacter sphaeroides]|uniref:head decoration protein n=1 Tax=Cereibacter sphaeroides TaxID=1063 RepID=UPI001F27AD6A|nr:head decoration protein [Cereibacter sphaeroides]
MSEAPGQRSREGIVISAGAGIIAPMTVLGKKTPQLARGDRQRIARWQRDPHAGCTPCRPWRQGGRLQGRDRGARDERRGLRGRGSERRDRRERHGGRRIHRRDQVHPG